jgi:type I restriction enzyme S subunit
MSIRIAKLGELSSLVSSGSTPKGGETAYLQSGPVMLIRSQNVLMRSLSLSSVAYIPEEIDSLMPRTRVEKHDVLLNITGASIGRVAHYNENRRANVNQHVCIIRPLPLLDSAYLTHCLASPNFQTQINHQQTGGTRQALTFPQIRDFDIPLPAIETQRRIAAILDKADAIRRKRQEAIALTEQLLRSTFLEMFGDPVTNPKRWPTALLKDLASIGSGVMKGRDYAAVETVKLPYMRVANVQDGYLKLDDVKTIEVPTSEAEKYLLQKGDILLTEGGDPDKLGRGAVWHGQIPQCIHQNHIFRVRPLQNYLTPEYLCALLGSVYGKRYFLKAAKQTTGIASINRSQLSNFPVLLPSLENQRTYSRFTAQHQNVTRTYQSLSSEADNLFNSLVQRAFTGQL